MKEKRSFMEKLATFIVDKRNLFFLLFAALCIFSAFSRNWVSVCDDITRYLPADTETRQGLDLMDREFTTFATARIMVDNITYAQAEALAGELRDTEGVKSVAFDETENHFRSASALFEVTFDGGENDSVSIEAFDAVKLKLAGYDLYVTSQVGNPLEAIINSEMLVVDIIAVIIVVSVLLLTSKTYAEIPVLLMTFGAAAVLNMGTNFLMGEISFVTDSIAIVLQLALAIDYAIILCNRYTEERETHEAREAVIQALSKAIPEISASSLTTVAGLLALCMMEFRLGYDMGSVLIKAILLSLLSVFLLMPGLLMVFSGWIDKTHHKSFVPKIDFLGKSAYATRYIMPTIFLIVLVAAFIFSHKANYVYSQSSISSFKKNETQISEMMINERFGQKNQIAVVIPSGDYRKEAQVIEEISQLEKVISVTGLANIEIRDGYCLTDELSPREFSELAGLDIEIVNLFYAGYAADQDDYGRIITNLGSYSVPLIDMFDYLCQQRREMDIELGADTAAQLDDLEQQLNDGRLQLMSGDWSRIVVEVDLPVEGDESYSYLNIIRGIAARYYDRCFLVGDTTSCFDLRSSFEKDNLLISILTVVFVVIVLVFTFKSAGLPLLLIAIIQGSIWCNFSSPYLLGNNLFFMTYLIVSSIQMGANIDYAIVISSRYMELKETMGIREAITETLNFSFPTIITSGTMMASAGMVIGFCTSNETICTIGLFIGTGTLISIFLVMCVLPQILILGEIIIRKTTFSLNRGGSAVASSGVYRIDGKIRGNLNGFLYGEVHGVFKGSIDAVIDLSKGQIVMQEDAPDEALITAESEAEE